jgi:hypothetical protein
MAKCRWCDMEHGPMCPTVKSIEFFNDGETVKKVEFKTAIDYAIPSPIMPQPWPQPNQSPLVPQWSVVSKQS